MVDKELEMTMREEEPEYINGLPKMKPLPEGELVYESFRKVRDESVSEQFFIGVIVGCIMMGAAVLLGWWWGQ